MLLRTFIFASAFTVILYLGVYWISGGFVELTPLECVGTGVDSSVGIASPSIHHFLTPVIRVQTKFFPLCSLKILVPSSVIGQVRPGAAESFG